MNNNLLSRIINSFVWTYFLSLTGIVAGLIAGGVLGADDIGSFVLVLSSYAGCLFVWCCVRLANRYSNVNRPATPPEPPVCSN